ncbi:MAG: hypothetical protein DRN04_16320 [Thermoprotei archaeon]|nr:MAG: hypothetical protein DRN04_16320 [Thermoprotei archaeon]
MSRESKTLKLLRVIEGSYKPHAEEVLELAKLAKLNKLYLAYLRVLGNTLRNELLREEARYRWFMRNAVEVLEALKGLNYALYKFRKPVEHVSVDLDILIDRRDIPKAVHALKSRGFKIVVSEPYTVTLVRRGFIVDLYTEPSFAWIVYMSGKRLLREHSEDVEVNGVLARGLSREAEVVVAAAHAVYKEHIVLLMDCLVMWSWISKRIWGIAMNQGVEKALEELLKTCSLVKSGCIETPYKLRPHVVLKAYLDKILHDPFFRVTLPNTLKYMFMRQGSGRMIVARITRKSY